MDMFIVKGRRLKLKFAYLSVIILVSSSVVANAGDDINFNTDILDTYDKNNFDLSVFAQAGYVMPGDYRMDVLVNQHKLKASSLRFFAPDDAPKTSVPCLTEELVEQFGLKENYANSLRWQPADDQGIRCLILPNAEGWLLKADLATSTLNVSIPQAYLEYTSANWDPPARWDNGILGMLLDYNANLTTSHLGNRGQDTGLSANGSTGFNVGAWRARADWQGQVKDSSSGSERNQFEWTRYYIFRPVKSLKARLTIGEDFLNSDIFDSFRFTGMTLRSDDSMLPPNLRGYAPQISGVAKTNATLTVRQQGAVLYQTQVAPGPFRIQDLNDTVSGQLDVEVEEQDGTTQKFSLQTSDIPYLTRPGAVRYKFSVGRPTDWHHQTQGPFFSMGEFSWGVANGWSLYGGSTVSDDYQAVAMGIGRDLMMFGALSFDVTHSRASLPWEDKLQGNSYRLSYSKRFDDYNSQVTFAGYRFTEKDYLSMADFVEMRQYGTQRSGVKEMYTLSFNQQLSALDATLFLDYNHRTYWDTTTDNRYNLALSRYFDFYKVKNINLSVNAYRSKYNGINDDGMYLSFSIPWGNHGSLSYNTSRYKGGSSNQVSYFASLNETENYQLSVGRSGARNTASGFYSHAGDSFKMNANASYQEKGFTSAGVGLQGGITATLKGVALHRINTPGGTRIMLDTDGVAGVPVRGYGAAVRSNLFGKAVIPDVNSYYRSQFNIDINKLGDDVDALNTVEQVTLTEGAIGYRHFNIVQGAKALVHVRLANGSFPPFGAEVFDLKGRVAGLINDDGSVYLSGIQPAGRMRVRWAGTEQCQITFPMPLVPERLQDMLMPCQAVNQ